MTAKARLLPWARVLRLSLFPSALADPVVGALLGRGGGAGWGLDMWQRVAWAALASLLVYHGAMALNDWADRRLDRERGRARPLPLGQLTPPSVLAVGMLGLVLGPLLALGLGLGAWASSAIGLAAIVAIGYDLAGRGPWLGPLLLAAARGLNLLFGALAVGWQPSPSAPLLLALGYGLFIFWIGRLGRMEDGEDSAALERRPSRLLRLLAGLLLIAPAAAALAARLELAPSPGPWLRWAGLPVGLSLLWTRSLLLWRSARPATWTPAGVEAAMGPALGSLVPFTVGSLLLAVSGPEAWLVAAGLLVAQRIGRRMMRVIPPS